MKKILQLSLIVLVISLLVSCSVTRQMSELTSDEGLLYYRGNLYSGLLTEYHPNETKKHEFTIVDGKKRGDFKKWHPNGNLNVSGSIEGYLPETDQYLVDGRLTIYNPEGVKILEENYRKGYWIPQFEAVKSPYTDKVWMDRNMGIAVASGAFPIDIYPGSFYFRMGEINEREQNNLNSKLFSRQNPLSIAQLATLEEKIHELPEKIEINKPCPSGFRLPFPGEIEEEINYRADDQNGTIDLNLKPEGKWSFQRNELVDNGVSSYYWVLSDKGYQIAHFDGETIEYQKPKSHYAYSVRCLFEFNLDMDNPFLNRAVHTRGPSGKLMGHKSSESGTLVIQFCVDRDGEIIFREINQNKTTISNADFQNFALSLMDEYTFVSDHSAPEVECGNYTFTLHKYK